MNDTDEVIERLCLAAGMIMEDSIEAALVVKATPSLGRRLELLSEAGKDIQAIASAASAISRRYGI